MGNQPLEHSSLPPPPPSLPFCLLCGNLGSGKTTVLRSLLSSFPSSRAASSEEPVKCIPGGPPVFLPSRTLTIVNDFHSINVDRFELDHSSEMWGKDSTGEEQDEEVRRQYARQYQLQQQLNRVRGIGEEARNEGSEEHQSIVVELSGGCVCCNLLASLVRLLEAAVAFNREQYNAFVTAWRAYNAAADDPPDARQDLILAAPHSYHYYSYVFLECTGVGESLPIVATVLSFPSLASKVHMDMILTVVDVRSLLQCAPLFKKEEGKDESKVKDGEVDVSSFLQSQGGLTKETLKGTNVLVFNAWEAAFLEAKCAETARNPTASPELIIEKLQQHMSKLAHALAAYSEAHSRASCCGVFGADEGDEGPSAFPDSPMPRSNAAQEKVKITFTNNGKLSDAFYSQFYRKDLFRDRFMRKEGNLEHNYFLEAYGERRVKALKEGRIIAIEKVRKLRRDPAASNTIKSDEGLLEEVEEVEVPMETQEARERVKLGLQSWALQVSLIGGGGSLTAAGTSTPTTTLRISQLITALRTREGKGLLKHVWRSKGFFFAIDDEITEQNKHSFSTQAGMLAKGEETPTLFRWQTVGSHVHYGAVLPPYPSLAALSASVKLPYSSYGPGGKPKTTPMKDDADAVLGALIIFLGEFNDADAEWKKKLNLLFTSGTLDP